MHMKRAILEIALAKVFADGDVNTSSCAETKLFTYHFFQSRHKHVFTFMSFLRTDMP